MKASDKGIIVSFEGQKKDLKPEDKTQLSIVFSMANLSRKLHQLLPQS